MSFQQVMILGNLGRDPELKYLPSGQPVCNFSVAVSEKWNDRQTNEQKEKTTWFRVAVYGQQAETCNTYLAKGRQVLVIGTVEARAYTDNAGQPAVSLELRARDVRFVGGRGDGQEGGGGSSGGGGRDYGAPSSGNTDDIPF